MEVKIHSSWSEVLTNEFNSKYFEELTRFVKNKYKDTIVYPPPSKIFEAFNLCPFDKVKVVILGQDPYHGPKQANGLSFSVEQGVQIPPSLRNIYKEMSTDIGKIPPGQGNLEYWAEQGIFMLNAILTVEAEKPGSHQKIGWEQFTNSVIKTISDKKENIVFILWGAFAQKKAELIDQTKHFVFTSVHPSPLSASRGFFGTKPFSKTNDYLISKGITPIDW